MGIIKASVSAMQEAAADQWKEAFIAGEMDSELLMVRAKRMTGQRSVNQGNSDVITDGSIIIVGVGECAIATEGGKVIGIYDQPGEQIFKSHQSRGIFGGGLGALAKDVGQRISFGGDVTILQRLYYINTKELTGGRIRAEGIPLRYKDPATGLDIDGSVSCYGSYTFRIADPERFYKVASCSTEERYRKNLLKQMDSEVLTALAPGLAQMTQEGVRPNELLQHTDVLCQKLRQVMTDQWSGLRGIEVFSVGLESIRISDAAMIRSVQHDAVLKNPIMAAAHITGAKAEAMQTAAENEYGAPALAVGMLRESSSEYDGWKCRCGTDNKGKFCTACGEKKPADIPKYQCDKCGWIAEDKMHIPKFCPECGDPFD